MKDERNNYRNRRHDRESRRRYDARAWHLLQPHYGEKEKTNRKRAIEN